MVGRDEATGHEDYVHFWAKSLETVENLKAWMGPSAE
jgi:hypothetical protein